MTVVGSVRTEGGEGVVRMEDRFDSGVDDVWAALTEPARLARWVGEYEGAPSVGEEFQFVFHGGAGARTARVDVCEPSQRLVVTMRDEDARPGQPKDTLIDVQCTAEGDQTLVVVEEHGLPVELLAAYGSGVQIHVENLGTYLAGGEIGDEEARWAELMPMYEDLVGGLS